MNFIWLKSRSGKAPAVPAGQEGIVAVDSASDPLLFAAESDCGAVILEVQNAEDAQRAMQVIGESHGAYPVWIHQPSGNIESTVAFMKAGASHVTSTAEELAHAIEAARESSPEPCRGEGLIGASNSMEGVSSSIDLVASRLCNVLIEGETGTGKEVVARQIHKKGNRSRGPWVAVNCGAIPDALLEAELFGHVRGAFTGAVQGRIGKFEAANHGTIFLDEIGDMPFAVQAKLLRVLQEKEVERLGGNEKVRLDVRVIAATNVNLRERVEEGSFRQDLYYRLNVFRIALPPLRQRLADIPSLARHFVAKACAHENLRPKTLDGSALEQLLQHNWPGNVRELENTIEMALILSGTRATIFASDIRVNAGAFHAGRASTVRAEQPGRTSIPSEGIDYQQALETFELDLLTQALARTRGNKTAAAELLRLKRTTLSARMRVLESRMPRLVA